MVAEISTLILGQRNIQVLKYTVTYTNNLEFKMMKYEDCGMSFLGDFTRKSFDNFYHNSLALINKNDFNK